MDNGPGKTFNICSDPILRDLLAERGIKAVVFDAVLSREEKTGMLESLERFSSNWFIGKGGGDYTDYRNVSVGAAIHDEVMMLFHLLANFVYIIEKYDSKNKITFYQSASCLMPDIVVEFLKSARAEIITTEDKYPWISHKEQFDKQAKSNFSRISFYHRDKGYGGLRPKLGQVKSALKQMISRLFRRIRKKPARNIYFHAHRSLMHFYDSCLNSEKNDFGIYISDTTPLESKVDKKRFNIFKDIQLLFRLARKGIVLDSLRSPFFYKWYTAYSLKTSYKKLSGDFCREISLKVSSLLNIRNKTVLEYFVQVFSRFYLEHLASFMKLVDFYCEKFESLKPDLCLQEMCHPFQAQVAANLGIPCRMLPSNHIIHNQYFAPFFLRKTEPYFKPLALSNLDAERFEKQGFDRKNIKLLPARFLSHWGSRAMPFRRISSLEGKNILILTPSVIAMDTFRYQLQNEKLYGYFSDVFEILSEVQVSSVTIRPHPGANVKRNQFGYADEDIFKYLIDKTEPEKKKFRMIFSSSYYHNLEDDILRNDIAIGGVSGVLFEVLIYGRDYIYYDSTVTPFYGTKDWTLFNEGTIKRLETKEELRARVKNYNMPDLDTLRSRLLENALTQESHDNSLDPFTLL